MAADEAITNAVCEYHGRKTGRRGPLFMDRYKSIITQDQNYLMELIRYVHLNPVRAGLCSSLAELRKYRWSGHRNLMLGTVNGFQVKVTVELMKIRQRGGVASEAREVLAHGACRAYGIPVIKVR